MTKKAAPPAAPKEEPSAPQPSGNRWYWIRTALITGLTFAVVMWYAYPARGNVAILWAGGLAAAILAYFVFSYYKLYR
jgi:hypothetical protein